MTPPIDITMRVLLFVLVFSLGVLIRHLWSDKPHPSDDSDTEPPFSLHEYLGGETKAAPESEPAPQIVEPEPEPPVPHTNQGWDNPHGAKGRFVKRPKE